MQILCNQHSNNDENQGVGQIGKHFPKPEIYRNAKNVIQINLQPNHIKVSKLNAER